VSYLAPAGTKVSLADIAGGVFGGAHASPAALAAALRDLSGLPHAWPVSSGRAAMVLILEAMRDAAAAPGGRDEIIVPAYTCYSVPAAIERAGLKPRLCDVDPGTLGIDVAALARRDFSRTLGVISANLYGIPNDLENLERLCRERGAFLLDDSAQALGARLGTRAVGSFGDAGLYSFDKGKIISTMQGGAIVCRAGPLAAALAQRVARLPASAPAEAFGNFAKLVVYSIFLRPGLYGLIRALPFTGLGQTPYETRYPITTLTRFQSNVAARLMSRLDALNATRRANAGKLEGALRDLPGLEIPARPAGAHAVFARYPLRFRDASRRAAAIAQLDAAGIGATASYPQALCDVPEVAAKLPATDRDCPGARAVAASILTLPTHAYCPPDLAARVRGILAPVLA
jgi:dTDP-4-amino-4,6-dideoxygalactose transaminase